MGERSAFVLLTVHPSALVQVNVVIGKCIYNDFKLLKLGKLLCRIDLNVYIIIFVFGHLAQLHVS